MTLFAVHRRDKKIVKIHNAVFLADFIRGELLPKVTQKFNYEDFYFFSHLDQAEDCLDYLKQDVTLIRGNE